MKAERTIESGKANWQSATVAVVAASLLMLAFSLSYRVLAARLGIIVTTRPISPDALEGFPLQVRDWRGENVPLDEAIIRRTDADALINRRYFRTGNRESISLYIACGVNAYEVLGHRPEGCYFGAGWTLVDRRPIELQLEDGNGLPCHVMRFSRGGLQPETVTVLHYFFIDGERCRDISASQLKVRRLLTTIPYVAQVQIIASVDDRATGSAMDLVKAFAADSAPHVVRLFVSLDEVQNSGIVHGRL